MTTSKWVNKHLDFAVKRVTENGDIDELEQNLQAVATRLRISPLEVPVIDTQIGGLDIAKEASEHAKKQQETREADGAHGVEKVKCRFCDGTGKHDYYINYPCQVCGGSGIKACPRCNGDRWILTTTGSIRCPSCKGSGKVKE
jgi:hypothetical protein